MSNRSGSPYSLPRDSDRVAAAGAVKSSDGITVQPLEVDGSGNLLVNVAAGGTAGTQYTDGASAPTHPIGTIPVYNNAGTITAVSVANPLPVTGGGGGTQYQELVTTAPATGTVALGRYKVGLPTLTDGQLYAPMLDPSGRLLISLATAIPTGTNGIGNVGTVSAVVNVGQQTVNTTAVQVSSSSTVPTNGIIIQALSTNSASIFVGGSGVTTSNGFEIQKGQAVSFTCNLNTIYIISAASTTDKICWNVE